jgi:pilus assembly protein TadC
MLILFFLCISFGIYLIACDLFHIPSLATTRAIMSITQHDKKHVFQISALVMTLSIKLGKIIKLNDGHRKELSSTLKTAGIAMQPETYIAHAIVKMGLKLLLMIPFAFLLPLMNLLVAAWAAHGLFSDLNDARKKVKKRQEEIDRELPRFVSTIEQELNASRDVQSMLEGYKASAGNAFRRELEITIADMKSGSQELALTRLESRVGTTMMSSTVRGLLSVIRGDNGVMHFAMLSHDFRQMELQQLKSIAIKRPDKLKVYSYILLAGFFATLLVPIGVYLMKLINGLM